MKSGYVIIYIYEKWICYNIYIKLREEKQMTEEQLLFKQETMSVVDFNEFLLNAVECGLINLDTALKFKGE